MSIQAQALSSPPSDRKAWAALTEQGLQSRQALVGGLQALGGQIGFIDLEFSVGRLGPGDLKRINRELKSLMFRAASVSIPFLSEIYANGFNAEVF